MRLLDQINQINQLLQSNLHIELRDEDFGAAQDDLATQYFQDACHAAIVHCVPWLHELDEDESMAVDEILKRMLEMELLPELGQPVTSIESQVRELRLFPVDVSLEGYTHLVNIWRQYFSPNRDLAGMATYTLTYLRHQRVIYHILPKTDWNQAETTGVYKPASLPAEGFIHCSKVDQVVAVANRYYAGQKDLLMICIASDQVKAEIRYENLLGGEELFPHIYGALNLDAVVGISILAPDENGRFHLPSGLDAIRS